MIDVIVITLNLDVCFIRHTHTSTFIHLGH